MEYAPIKTTGEYIGFLKQLYQDKGIKAVIIHDAKASGLRFISRLEGFLEGIRFLSPEETSLFATENMQSNLPPQEDDLGHQRRLKFRHDSLFR